MGKAKRHADRREVRGGDSVAPCHYQGVVRGAPSGSVVALSRCPTKRHKLGKSASDKKNSRSNGRTTKSTRRSSGSSGSNGSLSENSGNSGNTGSGSLDDDEVGISGFIDDLSGDYYYIEPLKPDASTPGRRRRNSHIVFRERADRKSKEDTETNEHDSGTEFKCGFGNDPPHPPPPTNAQQQQPQP